LQASKQASGSPLNLFNYIAKWLGHKLPRMAKDGWNQLEDFFRLAIEGLVIALAMNHFGMESVTSVIPSSFF